MFSQVDLCLCLTVMSHLNDHHLSLCLLDFQIRWIFCVCVFVFQIRSDKENYTKIIYSLTGPGVDQPPLGIFRINSETGFVKITAILDREEIPAYRVRTPAVYL